MEFKGLGFEVAGLVYVVVEDPVHKNPRGSDSGCSLAIVVAIPNARMGEVITCIAVLAMPGMDRTFPDPWEDLKSRSPI